MIPAPPNFPTSANSTGASLPATGPALKHTEFGDASASTMGMKWVALHDAAGVVAKLAGLENEPMRPETRNFPALMRDTGGWRRNLADQGIADLFAVMEPGLTALLAIHARGADAAPAALALWQEFDAACAALMALTPPVIGLNSAPRTRS